MASVNVGSVTASIVLDSHEFKTGVTSVKNMVTELKTALNSIGKKDSSLVQTLKSLNNASSKLTNTLQGNVNDVDKSIKKTSQSIKDTSKGLNDTQKSASNLNNELKKTKSSLPTVNHAEITSYLKSIREAKAEAKKLAKANNVKDTFKNARSGGLISAIGSAGYKDAYNNLKKASDEIEKINRLNNEASKKKGIGKLAPTVNHAEISKISSELSKIAIEEEKLATTTKTMQSISKGGLFSADAISGMRKMSEELKKVNAELAKTEKLQRESSKKASIDKYWKNYQSSNINTSAMQSQVAKMHRESEKVRQQSVAKSLQSGVYSSSNLSMLQSAQAELSRLDAKAKTTSKNLENLGKSAGKMGGGLDSAGCKAKQLNTNMGLLHGTSAKLSRTLGMFTSIYAWGFVMNLGESISNTVQAKSEMDAYVNSLEWGRGEVNYFNTALEKTIKHFQKMNKFNLGETALSLGVEFELGAKELEDAMPVLAMIQSEYIRAGRSEEEATLAVKDIMQGEFLRLSRETGVGKGELTAAGWSGDTKDIESLLEALKKVGESRHWDMFATKATSLSDVLTIAQNRLTEFATEIVSMVTPAITGGFNAIIDGVSGVTGWFDSLPQWAKNFISLGSAIGVASVSLLAFIKKRAGLRLLEISHYGLKNSIISAITGIKAECVAANGLKASLLSMITGLDGNIIKQQGFLSALLISKRGLEAAQLSSLGLMQKLTLLSTNLKVAQVEGMSFAQSLKAIATSAKFLKAVGLGVALTAIAVGFAMVQDACAKAKKAVDGFYDVVDMGDQYIEDWTKKVDNYKNSISTLESDYESLKAQGKDTTEVENNLARARANLTVATDNLNNVQKAYNKAKQYKADYDKRMTDAQLDQQRRMIGIYEKLGLTHTEATEKSNDYMANVTAGIKYMEEGLRKYNSVLESGSKHISEHMQYLQEAGASQKQLTTYAEDYGVELSNNADLWNKFIQGDVWAGVGVLLSDLKLMWIDLSNDPTIISFWNNLNATWQQILPTLQTIWNILKDILMNGLGALNSLMSTSAGRWVAIGGAITGVGVGLSLLKDGVKGTISHFKTLKEGISTFVTSIKNGNVKETLSDFGSKLKDRLTGNSVDVDVDGSGKGKSKKKRRTSKKGKYNMGGDYSALEGTAKKHDGDMKKTRKTMDGLAKTTTAASTSTAASTTANAGLGVSMGGFGASLMALVEPILMATAAIAVIMACIAALAAEGMILLRGLAELAKALQFDKLDLDGTIEGIKQVSKMLWELTVAMGEMAALSALTTINNIFFLSNLIGIPLFVLEINNICNALVGLNDIKVPSDETIEKLHNFTRVMDSLELAIGSMIDASWDTMMGNLLTFFGINQELSTILGDGLKDIAKTSTILTKTTEEGSEYYISEIPDEAVNRLKNIASSLTSVRDALSALTDAVWDEFWGNFTTGLVNKNLSTVLGEAIQDLSRVAKELNKISDDETSAYYIPEIKQFVVDRLNNLANSLKPLCEAMESLTTTLKDYNDILFKYVPAGKDMGYRMQQLVTDLKTVAIEMQYLGGMKELKGCVTTRITMLKDALQPLGELMDKIHEITSKEGFGTSADGKSPALTKLETTIEGIKTAGKKFAEIADVDFPDASVSAKLHNLRVATYNANLAATNLASIDDKYIDSSIISNNIGAMTTAAQSFNTFASDDSTNSLGEDLNNKLNNLKLAVDKVKAIADVFINLTKSVKDSGGDLTSSVSTTLDAINTACTKLTTMDFTVPSDLGEKLHQIRIISYNAKLVLINLVSIGDTELSANTALTNIGHLGACIDKLNELKDKGIYESVPTVLSRLNTVVTTSLAPLITVLVSKNESQVNGGVWTQNIATIKSLATQLNSWEEVDITVSSGIVSSLNTLLSGNLGSLISKLMLNNENVISLTNWQTNIKAVKTIASELSNWDTYNIGTAETIVPKIGVILDGIGSILLEKCPTIKNNAVTVGQNIKSGIVEGLSSVGTAVVNKITSALNAQSNVLYTKGRWIGGRLNVGFGDKLDLKSPLDLEISAMCTTLDNNAKTFYSKGYQLGEQLEKGFKDGTKQHSPGALYKATVLEMTSIIGEVNNTIPQAYTQAFNLGNALYQGYRSSNIFTNPVNFSFGMDAATIQDDSAVLYGTVQDNANNIMALNNSTVQSTSQTFGNLDTNMATTFTNITGNVTNSYNKIKNTTQTDLNSMREATLNNIHSIRNNWMQMQSALIASAETIRSGVTSKIRSLESNLASFWNKLQNPTLLMASAGDASSGKGTTSPHIRGGSMSSGFRKSATGLMKRGNTHSSPKGVKYAGGGKNTGSKSRNNNSNSLSLDSFFKNVSKDDIAFLDDYLKCMLSGDGGCYAGGWSFNWTDRIMEMIHQWGVSFDLFGDGSAISLKVGDFVNSSFPINGANGGAAAFVPYIISMISKTRYGGYYNSRYGNDPIAAYNAGVFNCWDGANIIAAVAAAFGLKSELRRGTWNGIPHVWRYVYGVGNVDATAIQGGYGLTAPSRCNYGGGVSAPRVKDNCGCSSGDTTLNLTINVNSDDDKDLADKIGDKVRDVFMDIMSPSPATGR